MDKQQRIVAYAVGETMLSEAQAGNKGAMKTLRGLGFTEDLKTLSPDTVGKRLSDKTQFRTGAAEKPLWASNNEFGKFAYQYKHFAYQWGIMVKDLVRERNFGAIAKMMVVSGVGMGEVVGDIRAVIKGYDPFMDKELQKTSHGDPIGYLKALTTRSKRFPLTHPIHRLLQNWGMTGGFGLLTEEIFETIQRPSDMDSLSGIIPIARRPIGAIQAIGTAASRGEVEPITDEMLHQIPGVGWSAWTKAMTDPKKGPKARKRGVRRPRPRRRRR
jgi:hypothetical protein